MWVGPYIELGGKYSAWGTKLQALLLDLLGDDNCSHYCMFIFL